MQFVKSIGIWAAALTVASANVAVAQTAATGPRHALSEICAGDACVWEKVATCSGFLEGINIDAEGTVWMLGYFEGKLLKVVNGKCEQVGEAQGAPNGAKLSPDGGMLIADRTAGIQSVDLTTGARTTLVPSFGVVNFRGLNDLVFDETGGYYFTEPYGSDALNPVGKVYYAPAGEKAQPRIVLENLAYPNGIALSADGQRVLVSEFSRNRIIGAPSVITKNPFDTPNVVARFEGGIGPDGLTVDASGNVYVAHFGAGEIVVIDAAGFSYGSIRLPEGAGPFTTNVAVADDGHVYVTEAAKNELWKLAVITKPLKY